MCIIKESSITVINALISNAEKRAVEFTYPVFIKAQNGKPDLIATSVVIELDKKCFLITAAHVLLDVLQAKSGVIIGVNGQYVLINGEWCYSSSNGGEHFDIAFTELNTDFMTSNKIRALPEKNLYVENQIDGAHLCFVNGYPASKNKQNKALRATPTFNAKSYSFVSYIKLDFDNWTKYNKQQDWHVCSAYGKKTGNQEPLKPNGLSGGGLWIIPNLAEPALYLCGIFIEYYGNDQLAFSTKLEVVIDVIRNA